MCVQESFTRQHPGKVSAVSMPGLTDRADQHGTKLDHGALLQAILGMHHICLVSKMKLTKEVKNVKESMHDWEAFMKSLFPT